MPFNIAEARKDLHTFDLKKLFIEQMGWDIAKQTTEVEVDGRRFQLTMAAQKRGFAAFVCSPMPDGSIPDSALRAKIETQVRKLAHEHLIIFTNKEKSIQKWQWVRRDHGKPIARREYEVSKGKTGDALLHRLQNLVFQLEEEEDLTIIEVGQKVKKAFDVEKVTKKFYDRFKSEHAAFMKFIKGIPDEHLQRWYTSVTLNRLMFIYFIQKKQFLDNDPNYLSNYLKESKKKGKDLFYSDFLCPLFFEGFARKKRSVEIRKLLGNVPYLNGGIFERHQIEELHAEKIQIPDKAFEQLFDFFDDYRWHLDERPNKADNEINPDVLGYIFEKYINQKQMGAYYTKEDITEYIAKNTIIPHLFDVVAKDFRGFGDFGSLVGSLLARDPSRYLYPAVRHGVIDEHGEVIPESVLPDFVQKGMHDPNARMFDRRYNLTQAGSGDPLRLPTETWREYVYRRQHCLEVRQKLASGEVTSINDLITLNLDIRQFAQDVIQDSDADLLLAFWKAISQIKVLDPTVGSGAFLFAALNVLEPLYEACVERMSALVEELDRSGEKHSPKKYEPFRKVLEQVRQRPDEDYFIFKSIIINNLYGVDIMEEAVEICKLRLFLKLASQVEPDQSKENLGIEPLPDIDFNIRAGNTLVGFATREDVKRSVQFGTVGGVQSEKLFAMPEEDAQLKRIEEKAEDVDRLYKLFRQQQTEFGGEVRPEDKRELQKRLGELEKELNVLLAKQYAIHNPKGEAYQKWLESHTPFHWFVEFFGIMQDGGFDVIIGNPPYVSLSKIDYEFNGNAFNCLPCNDLFALTVERSYLLNRQNGRNGFIIPLSAMATDTMLPLREFCFSKAKVLWNSYYSASDQPAALFSGVRHRLLITLSNVGDSKNRQVFSTNFIKWFSNERENLFTKFIVYRELKGLPKNTKISTKLEEDILKKISGFKLMESYIFPKGSPVYYHNAPVSWAKVFDFVPYYAAGGVQQQSSHLKQIYFENSTFAAIVIDLLNSSLFYWYNWQYSNCRDLSTKDISRLPISLDRIDDSLKKKLVSLKDELMKDLKKHKKIYTRVANNITTKFDSFYPMYSKSILDELDKTLATHYGFTLEELDFIINYDIKYRMGTELNNEEE